MPVGSGGQWYNDPEQAARAQIGHTAIIAAGTTTTTAYDVEAIDTLMATLNTHTLLRTTLTGTNNDLDIIARATGSGTTGITIQLRDPSANNAALSVTASAPTLTTSITGTNNDLVYTAAAGNYLGTVTYLDPSANNAPLQLEVNGDNIIVHLATGGAGAITTTANDILNAIGRDQRAQAVATVALAGGNDGTGVVTALTQTAIAASSAIQVNLATGSGGAITSTASQVLAAINGDQRASSLVVAKLQSGNDGTGVVTALAATNLANWSGAGITLDLKAQTTVDGTNWYDVSTAFTQKTTAAAAEGRAFAPFGTQARWSYTVGGTPTAGAFSVSAIDKRV